MAKILIMDDESALRNIVVNLLKPLGHQLFPAEDGRLAIETARKELPDVALLDMRVPDKDGLEVLDALRAINPRMKCIMLSGFGDVETAAASLKRGAFDYLTKPFKIDEVLKAVSKAVAAAGRDEVPSAPLAPPAAALQPPSVKAPWGIISGAVAGIFILSLGVYLYALLSQ